MVDAFDLRDALDRSTDLYHDEGDTMHTDFPVLLEKKIGNCSDWFLTNLEMLGIQEPLVIIIYSDGSWCMDEGHHRLAWALLNGKEVPVIFDDSGADDESNAGYMVSREDVSAYHDMVVDVESAFIGGPSGDDLAHNVQKVNDVSVFVPAPRGKGRHRAGRHHVKG
jgi:hypothetical protein